MHAGQHGGQQGRQGILVWPHRPRTGTEGDLTPWHQGHLHQSQGKDLGFRRCRFSLKVRGKCGDVWYLAGPAPLLLLHFLLGVHPAAPSPSR